MTRIVDLSHVITPGKAGRKFALDMVGAETVNPNVVRLEGQWYIMHDISMVSHIGTHIEAPYHLFKSKADLAGLPLEQLMGEAVLLDLQGCPRKSFELLAVQDKDPGILAVKADSPYKTMKDLMDAAKAKPGSIRACTAGILSDDHMAILMAEQLGGVKFAVVHFDGVVPGRIAALGGHVEAFFGNASELRSQVSGGAMRILAVFDKKRSRFYPDVKTAEEQGYPLISGVHHGIGMPVGAPKEIRDTLAEALKKVINGEEFIGRMEKLSYEPIYMDPQQYSAFWSEFEAGAKKWVELAK